MALVDYVRRQRQSQASGFMQSQPGDPNFSYSNNPGSQMQFPAAAAEGRLQDLQVRGMNRLNDAAMAGYDTSQPNFDPLRQAADQGFTERALTLGEGLLGWLDGPRQAVNLLIQDIVGGEAEEGQRNPNFGDYWNAMWGGVEDTETFKEETGLDPRSGSHTLDMFGWEPEDDFLGRIARGAVDFSFQMLTDPLTYVTFGLSGLGRKAASGAARAMQRESIDAILPVLRSGQLDDAALEGLTDYQRHLVKNMPAIQKEFEEEFGEHLSKFGGIDEMPDDMRRALDSYLGEGENPFENMAELALANKITNDVMKPLLNRDFKNINPLAREELPLWARGGARISIPFTQNLLTHGAQIPGTMGLGKAFADKTIRKVTGRLREHSGTYQKLARQLDSAASSMDQVRPLLQALRAPNSEKGSIQGWQYHIAMDAMDNIHNQGAGELINAMLRHKLGQIRDIVDMHGLNPSEVNAVLMNRLEDADIDRIALLQAEKIFGQGDAANKLAGDWGSLYPDLDEQLNDTARFLKETYNMYHKRLAALDPSVKAKFIDGYIPHQTTQGGRSILDELAKRGAAPPRKEWVDAQAAGDPGKALFARLIQGRGKGGRLETHLGGTGYNPQNQVGRMSAITLSTDDGVTLLDEDFLDLLREAHPGILKNGELDMQGLQSKYIPVTALNEMLEPVIREQAAKFGIPMPKDWDGKVFSEDAFEVASSYLTNLDEALRMWQAMDTLRAAGLAMNFSTAGDPQDVLQKLFGQLVKHTEKVKTTAKFGDPPPEGKVVQAPLSFVQSVRKFTDNPERDYAYHDPKNFGSLVSQGRPISEKIQAGRSTKDEFVEDVERRGVVDPITIGIDGDGKAVLLDGHRRLEAAEETGQDTVPIQFIPTNMEGVVDVSPYLRTKEGLLEVKGNAAPRDEFEDIERGTLVPLSQEEEEIASTAGGAWAGDSTRLKNAVKEIYETGETKIGMGQGPQHRQRAFALIRAFQRKAVRVAEDPAIEEGDELVRLTTMEELAARGDVQYNAKMVQLLEPGKEYNPYILDVGEEIVLPMESAAPRSTNKIYLSKGSDAASDPVKKSAGNAKKWVIVFDGNTRAMNNSMNNIYEPEWLVSGRFRVTAVDPQKQEMRVEYVGEAFDVITENKVLPFRYGPEQPRPARYVADQHLGAIDDLQRRFATLPWGPHADDVGLEETNILKGTRGLTQGVIPAKVIKDLKAAGFSSKDIQDTKDMVAMARMEKQAFLDLSVRSKIPKSEYEQAHPVDGLNVTVRLEREGKTNFRISLKPGLALNEKREAVEEAISWIDRQFAVGRRALTQENVMDLARNAVDEQTSRFLYMWLNRKVASLNPQTAEYLMKEPAELLGTRGLYDVWEEEINSLVTNYAALSVSGQLVVDPKQLKVLGDKDLQMRLETLRDAANKLEAAGYDEAVKVMRGIDDLTSVPDPDFVNPSLYALAGPAVDGMAFQAGVASWLRNVARNSAMMYTPEGVAAAKIATNNALRWWRGMATIARPSFHIRNLMGGAWMNMIHGVRNSHYGMVAKSAPILRKALREGKSYDEAFALLEPHAAQVLKKAWDMDIMSGFASTEFRKPRGGAEKEEILNWFKVFDIDDFVLSRVGGKFMENIEDLLRVSLFARYYDPNRVGSEILAREMVNATHFDYVNLTPLETRLKSVIPFFVWTRRNLPRQVQLAVENPRYVQKYQHLMQAMNDNLGGEDPGLLPEGDNFSAYAAGTDIFVNKDTPFWARVMIDPDLPINDLIELPTPSVGNLVDYANDLLGPHISTLVDVNEQREFGDVNAPAPFNAVLKSLAAVGLYDSTMDGDVRIPYYMRSVLETAFPFMRETIEPLLGGPTDPNRQARAGISQDDDGLTSAMKDIASIGLRGVGVKLTTPGDVRSKAARTNAELDDLIQELRLQGAFPAGE